MVFPDFMTLAQQCAPQIALATITAIVRTESSFNPYAIGVVGGQLQRQPASRDEAIATVRALDSGGWQYSVGLAQVNRANWPRYGLDLQNAFDPCRNLAAGAALLQDCYTRARMSYTGAKRALGASLSCYGTGDFTAGYRTGYVQRVAGNVSAHELPAVPAIDAAVSPIPVAPRPRRGFPQAGQRERVTYGQSASSGMQGSPIPGSSRLGDPQDEHGHSSAVVF
jgi:type IV secretion system protein VirB1